MISIKEFEKNYEDILWCQVVKYDILFVFYIYLWKF